MDKYLLERWNFPRFPQLNQDFKPSDFQELFDVIWRTNSTVLDAVKPNFLSTQPEKLRNPLNFYLGHPAAFMDEKMMRVGLLEEDLRNPFITLYQRGVDPAKAGDLDVAKLWLEPEILWKKRQETYNRVMDFLQTADSERVLEAKSPEYALMMGIEHGALHVFNEITNVRKAHESHVARPSCWEYAPLTVESFLNEKCFIPGGEVVLGKNREVRTFGWDNEYGREKVVVQPFFVNKYLTTNGDFLDFVRDGGYRNLNLWSVSGQEWLSRTGRQMPCFWGFYDGGYSLRLPFDRVELPLNFPAEVNAFEVEAYLNWRNRNFVGAAARLMSEAEFALASELENNEDPGRSDSFGINLKYGSPHPVGFLPNAKSRWGVYDLTGNVSEWVSNDFYPFKGFSPHHLYPDFSKPYFGADHKMLLGGGFSNLGSSASKYYRLWFRPAFDLDSGFRLAFNV